MTFDEERRQHLVVFNEAETHGWLSNCGGWSIARTFDADGTGTFAIHRRLNPRPQTTDARWMQVEARIPTMEKAAAIANARALMERAA